MIKLEGQEWRDLGPLPGADASGFGEVRLVKDHAGGEAVAKFIPRASDRGPTDRELLLAALADSKGARNIVPVLDMGEHEGHWVLVMPRADVSLATHLRQKGRPGIEEAVRILQDIATALGDLQDLAVHRDLKPANVLRLGESWCLTDFGIARYADEATGTETWKGSRTPPYAAPEIFDMGHATPASDIYSFGVMAFELLEGRLPFTGPDFATDHRRTPPPVLTTESAHLRELVTTCLYKDPATRPSPSRALELLARAAQGPVGPGASALSAVNARAIEKEAVDQAAAAEAEADRRTRSARLDIARQTLEDLAGRFLVYLQASASRVRISDSGPATFVAELEHGRLELTKLREAGQWNGPLEVICHAGIAISTDTRDRTGYEGRSHSLWYCDPHQTGDFAWYETAFTAPTDGGPRRRIDPFYLPPRDASLAFHTTPTGSVKLARPFEEVDHVAPETFFETWAGRFAAAASGKLQRPRGLPEGQPESSYRRRPK